MKLLVPPPIVAFVAAVAMWLVARAAPFRLAIPYKSWIAYGLLALAAGISILAGTRFRRVGTTVHPRQPQRTSALVTSGIFARSRNPMYLGLTTALTAWAVGLANPLSLLVIPLFVLYMTEFQIKPEEGALAEKFGAAYEEYRRKVRRWL